MSNPIVSEDRPIDKLIRKRKNTLQPRDVLVGLNYLFYLSLIILVLGFLYYLYNYREQAILSLPTLLLGALATLIISVISTILAVVLGIIGALGRLSPFRVFRWLATLYVEVVRGTPLLVQLLLWYFGIGTVLSQLGFDPYNLLFQIMTVFQSNSLVPNAFNGYFYGIIGLSFNYGAYLTEVFRTGVLAVDKGQTEAALSLGLNSRQLMRHIILPQAFRLTIPPLTNNFITLIQDSAFLSVLSVLELEYRTLGLALPQVQADTKLFIFILGALMYLLICYPLSVLAQSLERRLVVSTT